jgi:hypothetical protein
MVALGCLPSTSELILQIMKCSVSLKLHLHSKSSSSPSSVSLEANSSSLPSPSISSRSHFNTNLHNKLALTLPQERRSLLNSSTTSPSRAVCTVQVFSNQLTGPRLYFFASYYLQFGWQVIIYDRYGRHRSFLEEFHYHSAFHYHPFTVLESIFPSLYNQTTASLEVIHCLTFPHFFFRTPL